MDWWLAGEIVALVGNRSGDALGRLEAEEFCAAHSIRSGAVGVVRAGDRDGQWEDVGNPCDGNYVRSTPRVRDPAPGHENPGPPTGMKVP